MRPLHFHPRLFLFLFTGFILATIVGTLSHEAGHYAVAKALGYEAEISFARTSYVAPEAHRENVPKDLFFMTLGGPVQTILFGTIGLLLLLFNYSSYQKSSQLNFVQWLPIFLALFWLRQSANLATGFIGYISSGSFSVKSDEVRLAAYLGWPKLSLLITTAAIGLVILFVVVKFFVPKTARVTFLAAGLTGGIAGYVIWMYGIGPVLLP